MDALSGIDEFVQQVNTRLAGIQREVIVNISSVAGAGMTSNTPPQSGTPRGVDAEALAEHLYPHIRDKWDAEMRLRRDR